MSRIFGTPTVVEPQELRLSVRHGRMAYARFPVVVGHYAHAVIENTEGQLDRLLDGALSARWSEGDYPGAVGASHIELRSLGEGKTPPGAVVLGLGATEDMSPEVLRRAMAAGSLKLALRSLRAGERDPDEGPLELGLCSLLIGINSEAQISVGNIVTALVEGVLLANQRLRGLKAAVRYADLEFIELFEDIAIAAHRAIAQLPERVPSRLQRDSLTSAPTLLRSPDARYQRPAAAFDNGKWQDIEIRAAKAPRRSDKRGWLQYGLGGRLAGVDDQRRPYEQTVRTDLETLLSKGGRSNSAQTELVNQIFHALVPGSFKRALRSGRHVRLKVDEQAASFPWELLADYREMSGQEDPLRRPPGASVSMIRRFAAEDHDRHRRPFSRQRHALVIGDPTLTGGRFGQLRGARKEAELLATQLTANGYAVTRCIETDGATLRTQLQARSYALIHVAAHGHFEGNSPEGGIVVSDGYLSSVHFDGMDEAPGLVFLNCCWLGELTAGPPERIEAGRRISVGTAKHLIQMGCQAVVACAWPVGDAQAKLWSETFYDQMLAGSTLGQAVLRARQTTFQKYADNNTWAAYQVYGDPEFKLRAPSGHLVAPIGRGEFDLAVDQAISTHRIRPSEASRLEAAKRLRRLGDHAIAQPGCQALALARIGEALFKLSEHADALRLLNRAVEAESAEAPLRSIQRMAQCHSGLAVVAWRADDPVRALEHLGEAERKLAPLLDISPNAERAALMGSITKRRMEFEVARLIRARDATPSLSLLEEVARVSEWYALAATLAAETSVYELQIQAACDHFLRLTCRQEVQDALIRRQWADRGAPPAPTWPVDADRERWIKLIDLRPTDALIQDTLRNISERIQASPQESLWDRLKVPDQAALRLFASDLEPEDVGMAVRDPSAENPAQALSDAIREAVRGDTTCQEFLAVRGHMELLAGMAHLMKADDHVRDILWSSLTLLGSALLRPDPADDAPASAP